MGNAPLKHVIAATILFVLTYLVAGAVFYQLITKQFYVGDHPTQFSYLRSEADAVSWAHTTRWIFPAVFLRGLLTSLVLMPFFGVMRAWSRARIGLTVAGLVYVIGSLAAGAPSPSNIEGFVYLQPRYFSLDAFLLTQPEMLVQALLFGFGMAMILKRSASPAAEASA